MGKRVPMLKVALLAVVDMHTGEFARENDWNQSCYDAGYGDGQVEQFSQPTSAHCGDKPNGAKSYNLGYINGCNTLVDKTIEICESAAGN
ncbi:MAG: hypothetical protein ACRD8Z_28030 [Nitrososphaeraceae archaeon]